MTRSLGMYSALINVSMVALFALSMLIPSTMISYTSCIGIALSFIPLIAAFCSTSGHDRKAFAYSALGFAALYAVVILQVYFAQLTTVRLNPLSPETRDLLDYTRYGLFFSYDLMGYGLMALATFFAGLSFKAESKADSWLKALLMIHGIFFPACFVMPLLGLFSPDMEGGAWIGTAILEFWCLYFIPVGILSFLRFKNLGKDDPATS